MNPIRCRFVRIALCLPLLASLCVPEGFASANDRLYASALGGGERHDPGWVGMELGVESDQWSPHDIFAGALVMIPSSADTADFQAVHGVAGFSGLFLGYRLRWKGRISPFLGVSGLESNPTVENGYFSLNPECGVSVRLKGRYEIGLCGRYYFTTAGRDHDLWSVGIGLIRRCR